MHTNAVPLRFLNLVSTFLGLADQIASIILASSALGGGPGLFSHMGPLVYCNSGNVPKATENSSKKGRKYD
ncbi:hypothetical protein DFP72DRAFT_871909 [Ephemerocybe angulata]|uniref:Uncharacterized protein n=1 Tax=Ephemerocybe angulata TaxID=980116 RepID=A0A8H6MFQ4_9AGAR|nr:hypothetical protein DFP72DRAFT_871909 [Tulosesus angulatus]